MLSTFFLPYVYQGGVCINRTIMSLALLVQGEIRLSSCRD